MDQANPRVLGQELLSPLEGTQRLRIPDLCGESTPFGHRCKYIVKGKIFILGDKFHFLPILLF